MEEATTPKQAPSIIARSPESLRRRQRDRLSPRGKLVKNGRISTSVQVVEGDGLARPGITLGPAPRKDNGHRKADLAKKKQMQEGLRSENSVNRKAKKEVDDVVKVDLTPDGGSAGREGRQFTVANVGNNGKIYLR
jgi:hypothetical protein